MKSLHALRPFAFALATGFLAVTASAQTSTWKIDPVHSGIQFSIKHLGVSTVHGNFSHPNGVVKLDEKEITHSSVEATIDTSTVNTGEAARDTHLKSPDFFNVAQFPAITFKSTSLSQAGGKLTLIGELTLDGVTKPVTLTMDGPAPPQKGIGGAIVSGFSATGTLSRKDFNFGQKYGAPALGDEVKFTIDIEMDKQP